MLRDRSPCVGGCSPHVIGGCSPAWLVTVRGDWPPTATWCSLTRVLPMVAIHGCYPWPLSATWPLTISSSKMPLACAWLGLGSRVRVSVRVRVRVRVWVREDAAAVRLPP
eukprot:scaffold19454_cov45-Phaeocystis_antarctica.AAC.1